MVGELAARCQVCNRKIYGFFTVQPRVYLTVCVGGGEGGGKLHPGVLFLDSVNGHFSGLQ